jgi:hypothetical protein
VRSETAGDVVAVLLMDYRLFIHSHNEGKKIRRLTHARDYFRTTSQLIKFVHKHINYNCGIGT